MTHHIKPRLVFVSPFQSISPLAVVNYDIAGLTKANWLNLTNTII
jgi:hypothetical protein